MDLRQSGSRLTPRAARLAILALALVAALGAVLGVPRSSSASGAEESGRALIVAGPGSERLVNQGGSASEFSLRLPDRAACPGDSANDGYRVHSYMVPATVGPGDVDYDGLGPAPAAFGTWDTFRQPLYDTATQPYASAQTADADSPGNPGPIINIPALTFAVYGPGELPPGAYNLGIACTKANEPVRFWNTEVVLSADAGDSPAQVRWVLADASESAGRRLPGPTMVLGVAVASVAAALVARRVVVRS